MNHTHRQPRDDALPEYASIEAFVEYCYEDERETFDHNDLGELAFRLKLSRCTVRKSLESYGLRLATRAPEKRVRGFTSNPHDRWYGPGSCPTHGGSGYEQINGFAGRKG